MSKHDNNDQNESQEEIYSGHSHSFDTGIATALGLHAAIVFNHIVYWLRINASKGKNFHDGKTWMYETQKEIADFLGYLSLEEVKKSIVKLLDVGLLEKGNYNNNPFDKTNWYTTADQSLLFQKKGIQKTLTKAPYGAIDSSLGRDPKSPAAPSIYDNKNTQENTNIIVCALEAPGKNPVSDKEEKSQEALLPAYEKVTIQGFKGVTHTLCKNDITSYAVQTRQKWTAADIEDAWSVVVAHKDPIRDVFAFIGGTIANNRKMQGLKGYEDKSSNGHRTQSNGPTSSQKEKPKGHNLINGKPPEHPTQEEAEEARRYLKKFSQFDRK